ncbi:MAG: DUF1648 domain-containing protein [Cyclobacteriaceae bacterium]|nr:DUF1648 domain-containing protein [Cyclobacteriaceae bacterium]
MEARPRIKLALSPTDTMFEFTGWAALAGVWVLAVVNYSSLPDVIPIHFNAAGESDSFGGKGNILILSFVATMIFIGLTILNKFPHVFNYPASLTKENAPAQYTHATRMIRFLKMTLVIVFGLIVFKIIQNANAQSDGLGVWFLPFVLGLILIPAAYFIIKSTRIK